MVEIPDGGGGGFSVSPEHLDTFARTLSELAHELDAQISRLQAVDGVPRFGAFGEATGMEQACSQVLGEVVGLSTAVHTAMRLAGTATTSAKVGYQLADVTSTRLTGRAAMALDAARRPAGPAAPTTVAPVASTSSRRAE